MTWAYAERHHCRRAARVSWWWRWIRAETCDDGQAWFTLALYGVLIARRTLAIYLARINDAKPIGGICGRVERLFTSVRDRRRAGHAVAALRRGAVAVQRPGGGGRISAQRLQRGCR